MNFCPSRVHGCLGVNLREVLELVDHVAVTDERQACVVAELARHVNRTPTLVKEQRREAVA
jgi:hypothetical protein